MSDKIRDNAQEPAAEWVEIATLKPWDRNPRKNDKAVKRVADSIRRFGFGNPILARRADSEIIAGHTRLLAAKHLKLKKVPVRYLDLDPADAHLLALADNKLGEIAEWDDQMVAEILSEYGLEDAALAGFGSDELDKIAADLAGEDGGTEDLGMKYQVIVECEGEAHQAELLDRFKAEGLSVKALML